MRNFFTGERDVYLEIADKYEEYIRKGILREGEKLPSVRTAAQEIGVNPNTVERAYVVLEERGLLSIIPKKGAYVAHLEDATPKPEAKAAAVLAILRLKDSGYSREEIISAVEEVFSND